MDPPFMWSAFHLSMLDATKNEYNRWGDAIGDTIMRYMVRAFAWDRKPIDADNTLFTCNDFHKYINLSSYLDARRTFAPGLHTIVKLLKMRGGMAARNADTIIRHTVTAAAQTGDDPNMCRYLQLSGHFISHGVNISKNTFSQIQASRQIFRRSSPAYTYDQSQPFQPAYAPPSKPPIPNDYQKPQNSVGTKSPHAYWTETRCGNRTRG